ncbi:2-oxo acid dehydrogenase subunit E2 [Thermoactinospora rubra]|uniref:2-oxo acid dehydrogenase subunit E2 n=1 Tax=Thermoactinospora rubra TaxID=1088767 RepID=UPI000A11CF74|nr:2-oxo acid dehydrogenase subunit E2 [Thermoactinospora rubra]
MAELRVPKLNANDAEYLVVEWLVPDGAEVAAGDAVVLVETSKAAEELPAGASGVLRQAVPPGVWCRPDDVLAAITGPSAPGDTPSTASRTAEPGAPDGGPLLTAPARAFMDEHGIGLEQVRALGLEVVRRADLERLVGAGQDLSRVQRAVARAVELSHRTIPAAYLVVRMDLTRALAYAAAATKHVRRPVGLAEVFVHLVAGLHADFPLFFARLEGTRALLPAAPDIGVTVDVGEGLFVPVVHDAARRSVKDIATTLMKHRMSAATGEFREADLAGANFVVTLHTDGGVVMAIPFVFPGTACALAVTAPYDGVHADIGLAYDHRLINGRDAARFMSALKTAAERLDWGPV